MASDAPWARTSVAPVSSTPSISTTLPSPWRLPRSVAICSFVAVLALALVVRAATLLTQSAWLDEGYTMALARHGLSDIVQFTARYDAHPPLYYALLHLWLQVAGFGLAQGRLLSVLCGVAAVAALYVVAGTIFDRATAFYAAALLALSPVAVWYSDEVRMYAMAGFFALLALALLARAVRRGSRPLWAGFVAAAAAAFYTDYSAAYILAGAALYALVVGSRRWDVLRGLLVSAAALIALLLPGLPMLYGQVRGNGASVAWIPVPTPPVVGGTLLDLISLHPAASAAITLVGVGMAALAALAVRRDLDRRRGPERVALARCAYLFLACVSLAPLTIPLLLSLAHPAFLTRTAMTAVYGLVILFARGVVVVVRRRGLRGLLLFLPLLAANGASLNAAAGTSLNEDWRGAAAYLRAQALPGDLLLFAPGYLQSPFDLYWRRGGVPAVVEHGYPYDESLLTAHPTLLDTDRRLDAATAGVRTVWVLRRDAGRGAAPPDALGAWARRRLTPVGVTHLHDVSVYRYMRLRVAGEPDFAAWLAAASAVLREATPRQLVLIRGGGEIAFGRAWSAYPHPPARLLKAEGLGRDALAAAARSGIDTIVLVSRLAGHVDPANIAGDWLYHNGRQVGAYRTIGDIRVYTFALRARRR